jgi:hypothetical protein
VVVVVVVVVYVDGDGNVEVDATVVGGTRAGAISLIDND